MKTYTEFQQGSADWHEARAGIPTASQFDRIITAKGLKPSSQRKAYMLELLAERFVTQEDGGPQTAWMSRGTELEVYARRWYEMQHDCDVVEVGFCTTDDGRIGASPDGLVGDRGGLEIKSPATKQHMANMLDPDAEILSKYRLQVQGCIYVCERDWWDVLSYHPELPGCERRAPRDEAVQAALHSALTQFCDELDAATEQMKRLGCDPAIALGAMA